MNYLISAFKKTHNLYSSELVATEMFCSAVPATRPWAVRVRTASASAPTLAFVVSSVSE